LGDDNSPWLKKWLGGCGFSTPANPLSRQLTMTSGR
jgi:hypothetical protein